MSEGRLLTGKRNERLTVSRQSKRTTSGLQKPLPSKPIRNQESQRTRTQLPLDQIPASNRTSRLHLPHEVLDDATSLLAGLKSPHEITLQGSPVGATTACEAVLQEIENDIRLLDVVLAAGGRSAFRSTTSAVSPPVVTSHQSRGYRWEKPTESSRRRFGAAADPLRTAEEVNESAVQRLQRGPPLRPRTAPRFPPGSTAEQITDNCESVVWSPVPAQTSTPTRARLNSPHIESQFSFPAPADLRTVTDETANPTLEPRKWQSPSVTALSSPMELSPVSVGKSAGSLKHQLSSLAHFSLAASAEPCITSTEALDVSDIQAIALHRLSPPLAEMLSSDRTSSLPGFVQGMAEQLIYEMVAAAIAVGEDRQTRHMLMPVQLRDNASQTRDVPITVPARIATPGEALPEFQPDRSSATIVLRDDAQQLAHRFAALVRGRFLNKIPYRGGKAHVKYFALDAPGRVLRWGRSADNLTRSLDLRTVSRISLGTGSPAFAKQTRLKQSWLCMSLHTAERTLDLQVSDAENLVIWFVGLCEWLQRLGSEGCWSQSLPAVGQCYWMIARLAHAEYVNR
eukprot:TRINITY_DN12394_c0_g1_i1.p1 TRINITY_DN12394_c0_g1~~TRINITY_DN12394_c0_g1_i1.p1  ORF type:complete len:569 (+),score=95.94 TRINITY_DN12394_c0_g1_i1:75-1781(+)